MANSVFGNLSAAQVRAGTGTQFGYPPIAIFSSVTPASNAGVAETDLITYTLPANTLAVNGQRIHIRVIGTSAATANNKTFTLYFGGVAIATVGPTALNNEPWSYDAVVARTGASAQIAFSFFQRNGTPLSFSATPAANLATDLIVKVTGTSAVAGGDVTATGMFIDFFTT